MGILQIQTKGLFLYDWSSVNVRLRMMFWFRQDIIFQIKQSEMGMEGRKEARVQLRDWKEFMSGFFAGQFNVFATYPIHKTMFRQVVHHISVVEALRQLSREGSLVLYRGVLPPLIHKSISSSIMFGTYSKYSRILAEKTPLKNKVRCLWNNLQ